MFGNTLQNSHQIYCIEAETGELPILVPAQCTGDPVSERDKWILPEATVLSTATDVIVYGEPQFTVYREPPAPRIIHPVKLFITLVSFMVIIVVIIYTMTRFPVWTEA